MNWFKKLLKLCQQVLEKPTYFDIGHSELEERYNSNNIMWVYYDGQILTEQENEDKVSHSNAFPNVFGWSKMYYGRFEPSTGNLSIISPRAGVNAHRDVPMTIVNKLYKTFPGITQIHGFN